MCEGDNHRERAVEKEAERMRRGVRPEQQGVKHTFISENDLPRIRAHKIADPQWNNHRLVEQNAMAASVKGQKERQRVANQQRQQDDRKCYAQRTKNDREIEGIGEEMGIIRESEVVQDLLKFAQAPEAVAEEQAIRREEKERDPRQGWKCDKHRTSSRRSHLLVLLGALEWHTIIGSEREIHQSAAVQRPGNTGCQLNIIRTSQTEKRICAVKLLGDDLRSKLHEAV